MDKGKGTSKKGEIVSLSEAQSSSMYSERIRTCHECEDHRISRGVGLTCGYFLNKVPKGGIPPKGKTCGCVMSIKASMKRMKCPQNKWKQ